MSDRIVACPSCDCKIRIVLDGIAAKWSCGKCKQHFELAGETPMLIAMTAQALPPVRRETRTASTPQRFAPPAPQQSNGNGKVVILSMAGFCAFLLAFVVAIFGYKMLAGSAKPNSEITLSSAPRVNRQVPQVTPARTAPVRDESNWRESPVFRRAPSSGAASGSQQARPQRWVVPKDVDGILAALSDAEPPQQQRMIFGLASKRVVPEQRKRVIKAVKPFLSDSSSMIRNGAARVIMRWGDEGHRELYWKIARSYSTEYFAALERLLEMNDSEVPKQLVKNLGDPRKGRDSILLLSKVGPEAEELLIKAFEESSDRGLRMNVILFLGQHGTEKSIPFLESNTEHEDRMYSSIARVALTKIKSKDGMSSNGPRPSGSVRPGFQPGPFNELPMATDLDGVLSQLAAGAHVSRHLSLLSMRKMQDVTPQQRDKIIETATPFIEKDDQRYRRAATRVVCRYGEERHRDVFWMIAKSGDFTSGQAFEKLVELDDPDAIPHLIKMLGDRRLGRTAMTVLKKAGPKAEQPLIDAFDGINDVGIKVNAVKFFYDHGTEKSIPFLKKLAEADEPFVGSFAERSLEKIESRSK